MARKIIIFFVLYSVSCLHPGLKIGLNSSVYSLLEDYALPYINYRFDNISFKNSSTKIPIIEVNLSDAHFELSPITKDKVLIKFTNMSSKTNIVASPLDGYSSIEVDYKFGSLKDHVFCEAFIEYMDITLLIIHEITKDGAPTVSATGRLNLDPNNVSLVFTGGVTAEVLEYLEPIIKQFLVTSVDLTINHDLYKWVSNDINKLLSSFPITMNISDTIMVNYELTYASSYNNGILSIPLCGYAYHYKDKKPPSNIPFNYPDYDNFFDLPVQFFISDYLLNSAIKASYDYNKPYVNFQSTVYPFNLMLGCKPTSLPEVVMNSNISVKGNLSFTCDVQALNVTDKTLNVFQAYGSANVDIMYFFHPKWIQFYVYKVYVIDIKFNKQKSFNVDWFVQNLETISQDAATKFNHEYDINQKIPFPLIDHFDISLLKYRVNDHYLGLYSDFIFKKK